jgi:type I restriction enzyme S subunit
MSKLILQNEKKLPVGWINCIVDDLAIVILGQSPPSSTYNKNKIGLPFFQGKSDFGDLYPIPRIWCSKPKKIAMSDDVLLSVRAPVGSVNLSNQSCCIGRGLSAIRPMIYEMPSKYFLYFFMYVRQDLDAKGTGTTFKSISGQQIRNLVIPLPPLNEQKKIVEKIDELFSIIDNLLLILDKTISLVSYYKESLLFNLLLGSETNNSIISTSTISQSTEKFNILSSKMNSKKVSSLPTIDISQLPKIPIDWEWVNFSLLCKKVKRGLSEKCNTDNIGIRYITSGNLSDGKLKFDLDNKFLKTSSDIEKCKIKKGDLILNCVNSLEMIGKSAVVYEFAPNTVVGFNNYAIELWDDYVMPEYANIFFQSKLAKKQIYFLIKRAINQVSFATRELDHIIFPLPDMNTQVEITKKYGEYITIIEHILFFLNSLSKSSIILKSSILKHAFEGKLVSQNHDDEPAEILLEKIKQEKQKIISQTKRGKKNDK